MRPLGKYHSRRSLSTRLKVLEKMTLILTAQHGRSLWMMADRRLSCENKKVTDKACKLTVVSGIGFEAIFGYSGLGRTKYKNEPSEWMKNVVSGYNGDLQGILNLLKTAMEAQLPRHLTHGLHHSTMVGAIQGQKIRTFCLSILNDKSEPKVEQKELIVSGNPKPNTYYTVSAVGSGSDYYTELFGNGEDLGKIIYQYDEGKVSALEVADYFAKINFDVFSLMRSRGNNSVGRNCMVMWKNTLEKTEKEGGGFQFYSNLNRSQQDCKIPTVLKGMDLNVLIEGLLPSMERGMEIALKLPEGTTSRTLPKEEELRSKKEAEEAARKARMHKSTRLK